MGFWYFYVLPLLAAILLVWLGNKFVIKQEIIGLVLYFGAGVGYLIAFVFAVFYIYATIEEILTPDTLTEAGWYYFWSDNLFFLFTSTVLLTISFLVLKHGRLHRLQMK